MKVKYKEASQSLLMMASPKESSLEKNRSSINSAIDVKEHYLIDVEKLIPYHKQARRYFDESETSGLSKSIKEYGIRQPLTVVRSFIEEESKFEVVSGERRLIAAKLVGLQKVPCIILPNHDLAEEIALSENIQRQDLHPIEVGEAFLKILEGREGLTQVALSEKLGISNKIISDYIQYTKLPHEVKNVLVEKNITQRDFLRKLLKSDCPMDLILPKKLENTQKRKSTMSVLRILLVENEFHVQMEGINNLSQKKKESLKIIISKFLETL